MIDKPHLFEIIYSAIIPIVHNITLLDETLPIFWLICYDPIKQDKIKPKTPRVSSQESAHCNTFGTQVRLNALLCITLHCTKCPTKTERVTPQLVFDMDVARGEATTLPSNHQLLFPPTERLLPSLP